MELEDLKQQWQQATAKARVPQVALSDALKQKLNGPLDRLKRKFRNRLILIPAVCLLMLAEVWLVKPDNEKPYTYLSLWFLFPLCAVLIVYFYVNYRVVSNLQQTDKPVKANLQKQLTLLEKLVWWRLVVFRGSFLLFVLILEGIFYFSDDAAQLPAWSQHSVGFRVGGYVIFFVLFYFFSRTMLRYQYLKPIQKLKAMLEQTEG